MLEPEWIRTALHEQAYRHATSRIPVRPKYYIIGFWIMSALEKVKEQVPCGDVDIASIRTYIMILIQHTIRYIMMREVLLT